MADRTPLPGADYGKPDCPLCGGKGSTTITTKLDPPMHLGPDEFVHQVITSVGCPCIWATCPTCGYGYLRDEGHADCLGFNPFADVDLALEGLIRD